MRYSVFWKIYADAAPCWSEQNARKALAYADYAYGARDRPRRAGSCRAADLVGDPAACWTPISADGSRATIAGIAASPAGRGEAAAE
ncbi:MAG: hypothetical protein U0531_08190 [Dehalococcoidia bacterium]